MHKITQVRSIAVIGLVVLALLGAGVAATVKHHNQTVKTSTTQNTAAKTTKGKTSSNTSGDTPTSSTSAGSTSDADKQAAAASAAKPATAACTLLTEGTAQQILVGNTQPTSSGSLASYQATDTSVTACTYSNANGSVGLIIRTPTGHLGISENDTVFGSGRPAGAVSVQGYGESAYWNPSTHALNVLGSNNWYIITRNTNTQADAEAAAKLLESGF